MRRRKVQDILNTAFDQNILHEPPPFHTQFIVVDTDGCFVALNVSPELMEEKLEHFPKDIMEQLLIRRAAIRAKGPE